MTEASASVCLLLATALPVSQMEKNKAGWLWVPGLHFYQGLHMPQKSLNFKKFKALKVLGNRYMNRLICEQLWLFVNFS